MRGFVHIPYSARRGSVLTPCAASENGVIATPCRREWQAQGSDDRLAPRRSVVASAGAAGVAIGVPQAAACRPLSAAARAEQGGVGRRAKEEAPLSDPMQGFRKSNQGPEGRGAGRGDFLSGGGGKPCRGFGE